jgi:hypothetical protein
MEYMNGTGGDLVPYKIQASRSQYVWYVNAEPNWLRDKQHLCCHSRQVWLAEWVGEDPRVTGATNKVWRQH